MTNWLKYAAVTILVFVVFAAGYQLASARGDAALKSYQLDAANQNEVIARWPFLLRHRLAFLDSLRMTRY